MAVRDDGLHYPTETIVSKRARKHYRVPVRSQHWQLRSLISAERNHIVYFPGGQKSDQVLRLNTKTRECETIRLLTFAPRCLVARDGWLCCGGEEGEFVGIQLDQETLSGDLDESLLDLDLETRLPFGLAMPGDDSIFSLLARARQSGKTMVASAIKLANDRVNCITLWSPSERVPLYEGAYTSPVAVLANNDETVKLVTLERSENGEKIEAIDTIKYPDFVNRAAISPDGRLLVAVLDDPYLYVHERTQGDTEPSMKQSKSGSEGGDGWTLRNRVLLKSQKKDDRSDSRGSFAACFSASGAYLAIGTQHGTISIFNASLLADPDADPVITTFPSSRPRSAPGAIRDMAFCPGPFDILAWTEDRGHIGLADVRSNFVVRQILDLNSEADFEHLNILDRNTVDPRLLDRRGERHSTSSSSRGLRNRLADPTDAYNQPLSANETMVLEALQSDRRRRERLSQRRDEEWGISRASPLHRGPSQSDSPSTSSQERANSTARAIGDLMGNYRDQRAYERARMARQQLIRDGSDRQQTARRADQRWMDRLSESVAALRDHRDRQDSSYLSVLEILQARERTSNEGDHDDPTHPVPQVVSRWEESALRGTLVPDDSFINVPPSPDNTAGLSWSEDGRVLFIGAQNGIYEFHVNVKGRKLAPSVRPR